MARKRKINKHNPIKNGSLIKDENVYPIKKESDRMALKNYWLNGKLKTGRRDYMIFRLGMVTGLRASDLVRLAWVQIYDDQGNPRKHIYGERDKKTRKINHYLDIRPIHDDLVSYRKYMLSQVTENPKYMFTSIRNTKHPIKPHTLYFIMRRAGEAIGLEHCGSHSIRKTFGYIAYSQTHNLGYVMKKLNQSDPSVTLRYIGVERASLDRVTDSINWK